MTNPWKLTTIGLVAILVTALMSGLTTAYVLHAITPAPVAVTGAPVPPATDTVVEARRAPIVRIARTAAQPALPRPARVERPEPVAPPAPVASATVSPPAPEPAAPPAPQGEPPTAAASPPTAVAPADCATGGERAWRIAKPGAVGTLLGAGVGAAGGAIADGGAGAGKGALWGGLAGAALGSAWGAYKTHQECGTIFGRAPTR